MTNRRFTTMVLAVLLVTSNVRAQSEVALEVAGARVTYDGFLTSNAVTVAPAFSHTSRRSHTAGGVVATFFESGSRSSLLSLDGAWRVVSGRRSAVDLRASTGASYYTFSALAAEVFGGVRVRRWGRSSGFWAGADVGGIAGRTAESDVGRLDLGAWWRAGNAALRVNALSTSLAGTPFTDVTADLTWRRHRLEAGAAGGYRATDERAFRAPFGSLAVRVRVRGGADAGISWGRTLPDLLRASPGARFAMLTMRIRSNPPPPARVMRTPENSGATDLAMQSLTLEGDTIVLVVRARGVERVELSGDFTDWEPRELRNVGGGRWRGAFALPPGVYRFNVRLNGAEWRVPAGAGRVTDDFGGEAGVLVVHPRPAG